jgi:hypothetical protein
MMEVIVIRANQVVYGITRKKFARQVYRIAKRQMAVIIGATTVYPVLFGMMTVLPA